MDDTSDAERWWLCRFRPIPHDAGSHGSSENSKKPKKKTATAVFAGAPPQEMSSTVKLLFKEVAAIKREQQVRRRFL